ncbi:TPA: ATP-binding protein [Candidatus Micrarchaeota archaeon]|nr:ATP-binding protein [Candidatus Micrarchaeota archaeon]
MSEIKEVLLEQNPWWKEEFALEFKPRTVFGEMRKFLPLPQMIALTGLRRVGKTTLMLKIAQDFIAGGADAKDVVYFSFDEFPKVELRNVLQTYEGLVGKNLREGKRLVLLDEVQKLENWENQVKGAYDSFGKNNKIILSGSESLFIRGKSKETLAGRLFEFKVAPISFKEFLQFKNSRLEPPGLYEKEAQKLLAEFALTCGFPELVGVKEKEVVRKYVVEGIVEKIVYRDIPQLFNVENVSLLRSLINLIMEEPGRIIEITKLASDLKASRQTISAYLNYLEESFLVKKLYNFSKNQGKVERKLKKYYPTVISPELLFKEDELSKSKVFEWLAVTQLDANFFWRDPYKNEVDIVLPGKNPLPVEIKFGKLEFQGILAFMKKFKVQEGQIISKDIEEEEKIDGKTISVTPLHKFLLATDSKTRL